MAATQAAADAGADCTRTGSRAGRPAGAGRLRMAADGVLPAQRLDERRLASFAKWPSVRRRRSRRVRTPSRCRAHGAVNRGDAVADLASPAPGP